jgi:putative intracellular protease/amidase
MTPAWDCTDTRQALGVYVLGAIEPAERALIERHLSGCRECRDELAGLAGLPALLSRVSADEIGRISREDAGPVAGENAGLVPGGAGPLEDFATSVRNLTAARRRRNRRWQMLAAAAAVVIAAAGTLAGLRLASVQSAPPAAAEAPPADWQTARTTSSLPGVRATVRYSPEPWGTAVDVQISGLAAGSTCQLWVTDAHGVHLAAAGWTVSAGDQRAWYPGSSWVPASEVQGFDVTTGNRELATFVPR